MYPFLAKFEFNQNQDQTEKGENKRIQRERSEIWDRESYLAAFADYHGIEERSSIIIRRRRRCGRNLGFGEGERLGVLPWRGLRSVETTGREGGGGKYFAIGNGNACI